MPDGSPTPVTVLSIPAEHPYIASAVGRAGQVDDDVMVLPDAIPDDRPAGQWWPPVGLDPDALTRWLDPEARSADGRAHFDVVHVHFGFESVPLADLERSTDVLKAHHIPLVVTVHDLRNPHLENDDGWAKQLSVMVMAADALITLTDAAAAQIWSRWGREAVVIRHPHVAPLDRIGTLSRGRLRARPLVGLSLKGLRSNTLTAAQVRPVAEVLTSLGADLRVSIHREALDPGFLRLDPAMAALVDELGGDRPPQTQGHAEVFTHERFSDEEFLQNLAGHDLMVLPYRFGTHSGVLEACRDVGTRVVVPSVGCYSSQAPCPTYDPDDILGTLPSAVRAALDGPEAPGWSVDRAMRSTQAQDVRRSHRMIYQSMLGDRGSLDLAGAR